MLMNNDNTETVYYASQLQSEVVSHRGAILSAISLAQKSQRGNPKVQYNMFHNDRTGYEDYTMNAVSALAMLRELYNVGRSEPIEDKIAELESKVKVEQEQMLDEYPLVRSLVESGTVLFNDKILRTWVGEDGRQRTVLNDVCATLGIKSPKRTYERLRKRLLKSFEDYNITLNKGGTEWTPPTLDPLEYAEVEDRRGVMQKMLVVTNNDIDLLILESEGTLGTILKYYLANEVMPALWMSAGYYLERKVVENDVKRSDFSVAEIAEQYGYPEDKFVMFFGNWGWVRSQNIRPTIKADKLLKVIGTAAKPELRITPLGLTEIHKKLT